MDELLKRRHAAIAMNFTPGPPAPVGPIVPYGWYREEGYEQYVSWPQRACCYPEYDPEYYAYFDVSEDVAFAYYFFDEETINANVPADAVITNVTCDVMAGVTSNSVLMSACLVDDYSTDNRIGRWALFGLGHPIETLDSSHARITTRSDLYDIHVYIRAHLSSSATYEEGMEGKCWGMVLNVEYTT